MMEANKAIINERGGMEKEVLDLMVRRYEAKSRQDAYLEAFGEDLAQRNKWDVVKGMEAIHVYLIRKYGWLPRDVISMHPEELRLALRIEMQWWHPASGFHADAPAMNPAQPV